MNERLVSMIAEIMESAATAALEADAILKVAGKSLPIKVVAASAASQLLGKGLHKLAQAASGESQAPKVVWRVDKRFDDETEAHSVFESYEEAVSYAMDDLCIVTGQVIVTRSQITPMVLMSDRAQVVKQPEGE